jgi:hypothetical protein
LGHKEIYFLEKESKIATRRNKNAVVTFLMLTKDAEVKSRVSERKVEFLEER